MAVLFGGEPCLDPRTLYRQCLDLALPTTWFGLANAYTCPLGTQPGEGWLLMTLASIKRLDSSLLFGRTYPLVFASQTVSGPQGRVEMGPLVVLSADCLTPGALGDDNACYLLRLADRRHLLQRRLIDRGINFRHVLTKAWIPRTLNDTGNVWTFGEVTEELWHAADLGDYPGLPFPEDEDPSGEAPEDLELYQTPALDALALVLDRLGCALAYDPVRDTFRIARVGVADPALDAAETKWRKHRVWDAYPVKGALARIPETVRVTFRKLPHVRGEGSPFYALDRGDLDDVTPEGIAEPGSVVVLPDDLEARYNAWDMLENGDELVARATERARDYYRMLWSQVDRQRRVYPLPLGDVGLMPGSQVQSIRWADTTGGTVPSRGMVTEVTRVGDAPRPGWPDVTIDPLTRIVKIAGDAVTGSTGQQFYPARIQAWQDGVWVDKEAIWLVDANS